MSPCPICKKAASPRAVNEFAPFCSARCRQIDLGQWLSEKYRVPVPDTPNDGDDSTDQTKETS